MGWIKKMNLKKALFTLTLMGLVPAALLSAAAFFRCVHLKEKVAPQGVIAQLHNSQPVVRMLPQPSEEALRLAGTLEVLQLLLPILFFVSAVFLTSSLFYRIKLKEPIGILKAGADRIMTQDLDFSIPEPASCDELGLLCSAFEKMRKTLLANNRFLWQQAEERKRLNAAFAHDLRNPVTVLKGTVTLLEREAPESQEILCRLKTYTSRIEQYIEAMSSIQRLEQMPLQTNEIDGSSLTADLRDAAKLLAPGLSCSVTASSLEKVRLDCRIFSIVAQNLIGNAARFAKSSLSIGLEVREKFLILSVSDDGPGYPRQLLQNGPLPFGSTEKNAGHFGMGLYSCRTLCLKHGGELLLTNAPAPKASDEKKDADAPKHPGASAEASFYLYDSQESF